jgi:hypothetical protein
MLGRSPLVVLAVLAWTACVPESNPEPPGPPAPETGGASPAPPAAPPAQPPTTPTPDAAPATPPDPLPPPPKPDAGAIATADAAGDTAPAAGGSDARPATPPGPADAFTCTLLIGINATAEWFNAGFETMVDGARWELVRVHSGFVDLWANPDSAFWSTAPTSACAMNPRAPDRIIFVGLRFEWTSKDQWVTALTGVVKNIKAKYPGIKRIELATFVRGPGNKPCGSAPAYRSTIHPSQDEAIAQVVATEPGLLLASPKFEVAACSEFSGNPPHFSSTGTKAVAARIAQHYGTAR